MIRGQASLDELVEIAVEKVKEEERVREEEMERGRSGQRRD